MPAARLVTSEMPSTSSPASRAAMVSSVVDMPTRSPPSTRPSGPRPASRTAGRGTGRRRPRAARGRPRGRASRSRREYASVRSMNVAPRPAGVAPVRLMWSLISTGVPGAQSRLRPPQPLVSTIISAPAAAAVRTPCTTGVDPAALVEVGAPGEDRRRSCRPGCGRRAERAAVAERPTGAAKPGSSASAQLADRSRRDRRRRPTSRSPARRPGRVGSDAEAFQQDRAAACGRGRRRIRV